MLDTFHFNPELARQQAAEAVRVAKHSAATSEEAQQAALKERDELEKRMQDMKVEHLHKIETMEKAHVQQSTEYEDKIAMLEGLVVKEREARQKEALRQMQDLQHACDDAERRARELESRHSQSLAASEARAKDAEERLEIALQRRDNELEVDRVREEGRVKETRDKADACLRETQHQKRRELQQMHEHVTQRHKAMDETLVLNGRQKSEAVAEAQRHATELTIQMEEYSIASKADKSMMELRYRETLQKQKKFHDESMHQQKNLFDHERALHDKTIERTMGRLLGLREGAETPTALLHQTMLERLPANHPWHSRPPNAPAALSSTVGSDKPLARIGESLVA